MPVMTEIDTRPEDVGQILVKVQDDLRQLKEQLLAQGDGRTINVADLETALAKTEKGLQRRTEEVVHQINNSVTTLPLSDSRTHDDHFTTLDTTWDLRHHGRLGAAKQASYYSQQPHPVLGGRPSFQPLPPGAKLPLRQPVQSQGLTPGQQHKQQWGLRAVYNPYNSQSRSVLQENYGIQLPLIADKREARPPPKPVMGSTIEHLSVLPKANRVDAQLAPPPINEDDAQMGILSLLERGLIPPAAQLTLDPSPVKQMVAPLHDPQDRNKPPAISDSGKQYAGLHLDNQYDRVSESYISSNKMPSMPSKVCPSPETRSTSARTRMSSATGFSKTPATIRTYEMPLQPLPPPTTPASGDFKALSHRFALQNGKVRDSQPEFLAFKQHYCLTWGSIVSMIRHLERLMTKYSVPVAFISGDKLADLSMEFELERPPTVEDLLTVIVNREDVEAIIRRPGRRYLGYNGQQVAATHIQASWRRYKDRSVYLDYRRHKWAAGVIAISWIMHIKMVKVRQQLKQTRLDQLESFKMRSKKFASSWDRIKMSKRVVIHLPSLGLIQSIRDSIHEFGIRQNTQMARLCDIRDPNVDVIFVSPVPLSDETLQYYFKLLGLKSAVDSGVVEDQCDMAERYKIIVPEAIKSFPTHRMCLATLLRYSPETLKRIKNLIRGREAFIVTGIPHKDDLAVADILDVPILSPEPDVAHLYSTKSGSKRIFNSAGVDVPPGEYDIYSLGQLHECLAQLVTENLTVKRWLFKLDDEFDGRGIAYCDIAGYLKCHNWALKESHRYGEKWSKKWAQEAAYIKIHAEIPDVLSEHGTPINTDIYKTWDTFLEAFLSQGGVIEACPPSESITCVTVDMMIEPSGVINILTCGDQIHAETPFSCWGLSLPQSSIEPDTLNTACYKVAEACKSRGIVGYYTIDFVTFIDGKTMEQRLWALDLSLRYSDTLAMFQLVCYVTAGSLDTDTHTLNVSPSKTDKKPKRRRLHGQEEDSPSSTRYAVMSTHLLHTNLAVVHYSVFFQMCRAHGIGYDIKEKQGTVFTLVDSFNRERLGMLTIGDNLQGGLATFARNMSVIHQEISAPNMQGKTNFKGAIEDIEGILGTTIQNAEEQLEEAQNEDEA
ncbi:IQ domain-containing protein H-like isoform X2 [Haliotis rufescens]|uniref:IQ domain-containing protein H-like isoform X2 n=1 Tax=Haliotis rufescens TaxID=6454 RepID=UPI00201ECF08|nr:IQ domain-containing protein H-like isoform X2 [Haliotis rufescens]